MNKVLLTGNLVNIRTIASPSGNLNAFVTLALINWRKKTNQNQKSIFITVNFFDVSQNYVDNLKKARLVSIEGHMSTYNQKVGEEKIIKMLSVISDRCQVLLYKKPKSDDFNEENSDFLKNPETDSWTDDSKKTEKTEQKIATSSDDEVKNMEDEIFLTDDGDLF